MTDQCQEWIAHCVTKYPCKGAVLEVGSFDVNGNPRSHFANRERFSSYIGIDMREGPGVDRVMNVQQMEFADDSFDVIVDAERLEHDNRFWVSVKELFRVCKPGGYIIVTTRSWGGMHPHAYPHDYWRFMDSGLRDLLEYGGFRVLATAYGERWAGGDKAVFAVAQKPLQKEKEESRFDKYSIVIPSKNPENLIQCVRAIIENEPDLPTERIIVVDDGAREKAESQLPKMTWVQGVKPFIFARNVNLGIKAANSDVIVLNDDAKLVSRRGFINLAKHGHRGVVSASIHGTVGNYRQICKPGNGLIEEHSMLCFMAVLIPHWVQNKIGLLDERFSGYGFEDNDYSRRTLEAGIGLWVDHSCIVEHESLQPTFRSDPNWVDLMHQNQSKYAEKWA